MDANLEALLNQLGEAERAGGRVLHELIEQADSLDLKELLKKVEHDEGYYAGQIGAHVRRLGGSPSNQTGEFVEKVRAVTGLVPKLQLLNRGQGWVVRKIDEVLPSVADLNLAAFLRAMAEGHRVNIGTLDAALKQGAS
jgi:nitronate monooxygenase